MTTINKQISRILDMRLGRNEFEGRGHLHQVEDKIYSLKKIRQSLLDFQQCKTGVDVQVKQQEGEFYKILCSNPQSMTAYELLDLVTAIQKVDDALSELGKLRLRFKREAVRIAFIGHERQGKSTFIQSMTGLPNEVIPAYDGTSCTGAVSVIHNADIGKPFIAKVEFYTLKEFLDNVNSKLRILLPGKNYVLNSLDDLDHINLKDFDGDDRTELEGYVKKGLIDHKSFYGPYLGRGVIELDNKDETMKFVAQYREFSSRQEVPHDANPADVVSRTKDKLEDGTSILVWRHMYYWYLAVKSVNIYCKFPNEECGKIEFVDTIGLGPVINADSVEKEMFRVLLDDCDGAVDIFCPSPIGGSLPDRENKIFTKLKEQLSQRDPQLWMSYAINAIPSGEKKNTQNIEDIETVLSQKSLPFGFYCVVNAADRKEVNDKLLIPHLQMVAQNLQSLDEKLIASTSVIVNDACKACKDLVNQAISLIPIKALSDWNFDIDGFEPLTKSFNKAMNALDHDGYAKGKNKPCTEISKAYKQLLESIDECLPSPEEITKLFKERYKETADGMFNGLVEELRNHIFSLFEDVNHTVLTELQEKVKLDLIGVLYNQGLWSRLPLSQEDLPKGPSIQWMESIINDYVPVEKYPKLHEALRYILDYKISIVEDLVEYNVTESLHIIERGHPDFRGYVGPEPQDFEDKGEAVWQELAKRLMPVQTRLTTWSDALALIPSQSFYTRVHKFFTKVGADSEGQKDFLRFYAENMGHIWQEDIKSKARENSAFKEWSQSVDTLRKSIGIK